MKLVFVFSIFRLHLTACFSGLFFTVVSWDLHHVVVFPVYVYGFFDLSPMLVPSLNTGGLCSTGVRLSLRGVGDTIGIL